MLSVAFLIIITLNVVMQNLELFGFRVTTNKWNIPISCEGKNKSSLILSDPWKGK